MADTLCGPSNALQNVQKHTAVDRSLQQDRIALRQQPSQTFRSSPTPGPSYIDAEFNAFQASQPLLGRQSPLSFSKAPPLAGTPQASLPSWASDFQNLNLRDAAKAPLAQPQFRGSPLQRGGPVNWHQEFMQHNTLSVTTQSTTPQSRHGLSWQPSIPSFAGYGAAQNFMPTPQLDMQGPSVADAPFDEAAFERAFDAAGLETAKAESRGKEPMTDVKEHQFDMSHACIDPGDVMGEYDFENSLFSKQLLGGDTKTESSHASTHFVNGLSSFDQANTPAQIGSDMIVADSTREQEDLAPENEADELAKTAGLLLENLKDEHSQKFQRSNFLELMRQLRDKEVRVEGDKMVTSPQPHHPGGPNYPIEEILRT